MLKLSNLNPYVAEEIRRGLAREDQTPRSSTRPKAASGNAETARLVETAPKANSMTTAPQSQATNSVTAPTIKSQASSMTSEGSGRVLAKVAAT